MIRNGVVFGRGLLPLCTRDVKKEPYRYHMLRMERVAEGEEAKEILKEKHYIAHSSPSIHTHTR
jgi:hypothetical protein